MPTRNHLGAERVLRPALPRAHAARYGDVVPLIDAAYGAGAHRVGIITERMLFAAHYHDTSSYVAR